MKPPGLVVLLILILPGCSGFTEKPRSTAQRLDANAPPETAEFGRFQGTWECDIYTREAAGGWKKRRGGAQWRWFYILEGHAVQDIWEPEPIDGGEHDLRGTNLRIYDPEKGVWRVVWIDSMRRNADFYEGRAADGEIVLTREAPTHRARVSFYNISAGAFDWKHEISDGQGNGGWRAFQRLHCVRSQVAGARR